MHVMTLLVGDLGTPELLIIAVMMVMFAVAVIVTVLVVLAVVRATNRRSSAEIADRTNH
jgi:heme/copper-type cytochrome/quinol oxidase subunit 2